jgi:AraC-like DNA-binding protein
LSEPVLERYGIPSFLQLLACREESKTTTYSEDTLIVVRGGFGKVFHSKSGAVRTALFGARHVGIFQAGFRHTCQPLVGAEFLEIAISSAFLNQVNSELEIVHSMPPSLRTVLATDDPVTYHLTEAIRYACNSDTRDELSIESGFHSLAVRLLNRYAENGKVGPPPVGRGSKVRRLEIVADSIRDNPSCPFTLVQLASLAAMSRFHFLRQFKAQFGLTPAAFVRRERVALAARLLEQGSLSLPVLASVAGFGSVQGLRKAWQLVIGSPMRQHGRAAPVDLSVVTARSGDDPTGRGRKP